MDPGLIWILAGLVGLGVEMLLPGVYMVWAGTAAIGTGLVLLFIDPGFALTVLLFLVLLAAGVAVSLQLKRRQNVLARRVNAPEAGLAGRQATVVAIDGSVLRVRLGDSDWPARMPRNVASPAAGTMVRVEAVDGTMLVVRPLDA